MTDTKSIFEKKNILDNELKLIKEEPDRIKHFQSESFDLIREISLMDEPALNTDVLKIGIDLICKCCRTRISLTRSGGFELIKPVMVSDGIRTFCSARYDEWLGKLRKAECTFIPDHFERSAPDREKLLSLQRNYLSARTASAVQAQKKSVSFSRLLGGRG